MPSEKAVQNQIALVTGANRGIGLEVSRQLLNRGFRVLLGSRDLRRGESAAQSLGKGRKLHVIQLDVTDTASIGTAASKIGEEFGRLDVLVNNAGGNYDQHQKASQADLALKPALFFEKD